MAEAREPGSPQDEALGRAYAAASAYIAGVVGARVNGTSSAEQVAAVLGELRDDPAPAAESLDGLLSAIEPGLVASTGPRYFGFVVGGALPIATAADWLAAAWDQNAALEVMSPAMSAVEQVTGRWLLDLLGLPPSCSVGFVTGATMANWTALAAAREHVLRQRGWDVATKGLADAPPIRVIAGAGRHTTIDLAIRYLGIGTDAITVVPQDPQGRMIPEEVDRLFRTRNDAPTIVCAQAGNVNSGAVDDVGAISDAAHRTGAWVHVDAAVCAWLAAVPTRSHLLAGWDRADSWATDAHKGLNVPYDSGVVFTAHPQDHRAACVALAPYLLVAENGREGSHWTPESSRRARALPIHAVLRRLGRKGVAAMIEQMCLMAARFAEQLAALPGVRVLNEVTANQVLVRFHDSDDVTARIVAAIQDSGVCWMGSTLWQDELAMRISVSNWSTSPADVDRSVAAIASALRAV